LDRESGQADLVYQLHNQKRNIEVESKNKRPFTSIFEQFLDEKAFSAATKKLYQDLHDQLLEWCSSVCLEEFDLRQWTEFRNFLKHKKKHSTNTICIRLNKLKAMIKYLKSTGHNSACKFPVAARGDKKGIPGFKRSAAGCGLHSLDVSNGSNKRPFPISMLHCGLRWIRSWTLYC
jgi:hypothetical protein